MGITSLFKKKEKFEVTAIVVASGNSARMGTGENKVFLPLRGKPVIAHCLEAFEACESVQSVIVVTRECDMLKMCDLVDSLGFSKVKSVVVGGGTRAESVKCGLEALPRDAQVVAIHDGARPFVSPQKIDAVVAAARTMGGAILAVPCTDTVKRVKDGVAVKTLNREELYCAQTPQAFLVEKLFAAISINQNAAYTDDSQYFEKAGFPVAVVEGDVGNVKITYKEDIAKAEGLSEVN